MRLVFGILLDFFFGLGIGFSIPEQGLEYSARLVDLPELQITLFVSLRVLFHLLSSLRGGHWP